MVPTYLQCFNLRAKFRLTFRNLILKSVVYSGYGNFIIYSEMKNCTAKYLRIFRNHVRKENKAKHRKTFQIILLCNVQWRER